MSLGVNFDGVREFSRNSTKSVNSAIRKLRPLGQPSQLDVMVAAALALAAFALTLIGVNHLGPDILHYSTWDYWFESDPARIAFLADERRSYHHHSTSHHPLFSLVVFPQVKALEMLGLSPSAALATVLGIVSALFALATYSFLRLVGARTVSAATFTLLTGSIASTIFWFPVAETFSFGALSIVAVLVFAALTERAGGAPFWMYVAAGVVAISMTTTNWTAALAVYLVFLGVKRGAMAAIASMVVTLAIWAIQHSIFPESDTFLNVFKPSEVIYIFNPEGLGLMAKLIALLSHAIVMPEISEVLGYRLSVQSALPGEGSILGVVCVMAFGVLLALGVWGIVRELRSKKPRTLRKTLIVLLLAVAGQILVSATFGIETFLYTAHSGGLLVLVASYALFTPVRAFITPLAGVLAIMLAVQNTGRFVEASDAVTARYEHRMAFAEQLAAVTTPDDIIICGGVAQKGLGELHIAIDTAAAPINVINHTKEPHSCSHSFDGVLHERRGWIVWNEDWSIETIEALKDRGGRYFATHFIYGLKNSPELFDELDRKYHRIVRTPDMAIYDLGAEHPAP